MFIYIFASPNGQLSQRHSLNNPSLQTQEPSLSYANFALRLECVSRLSLRLQRSFYLYQHY